MDPGDSTHDLNFFPNGVVQASTNIRDESLRLKAENERLENLLSEVIPELKLLREERGALKAAIGALLRQSGALPGAVDHRLATVTFASLPNEILQHICTLATAEPTYQFDPSVQPGAHSPWLQLLRTKKAFPLICRASFWPGMSILYSDIVLRRMGQVSALANTLRTPDIGPRFASLVKGIRWESCVVAAPCSDVIREDLTFIFGQCVRLRSFSYHSHTNFPLRCPTPDADECEGFFNPLWFVMMSSSLSDQPLLQTTTFNLRVLEMDLEMDGAILQAIVKILPTLNVLESLALGPWPIDLSQLPGDSELVDMPVVPLPSLTNLRVFATEPALDQYLCSRWEVPQLARLTILSCTGWPGNLLARFGCRLRYLHLFPTESAFSDPDPTLYLPCSTLSTVCPLLEHLIVPKLVKHPLSLYSPTLVHLDLWTTPNLSHGLAKARQDKFQAAAYRHLAIERSETTVPSLRTVRFIFTSVADSLWSNCLKSHVRHPDWPWICHPSLLSEGSDDVLYYRFPQGWVAQTVAAIIPQELVGSLWSRGRDLSEEGWPTVYGHLDKLLRIEANTDEGAGEQEAQGGATLCSDGPDPERELEGDDGAAHMGELAAIGDDAEAMENEEQDAQTEEEDMFEAAAELASVPEYPVVQLDRAAVLTAFRSSRDRESYHHVDIWDINHEP